MFQINLILLVLLPFANACSQIAHPVPVFLTAGSFGKKFTNAFSLAGNPASLVSYKYFTAGVYADRRFMLAGLKQYVLAAGNSFAHGALGMQLNYLSSGIYNQSEIGIAYAKQLGEVDLGLKLNYYTLSIAGYGKAGSFIVDLGSNWHLTNDLHAGIHLYNPLKNKSWPDNKAVGYVWKTGLTYEVSGQVMLHTIFIKEEDRPININAGVYYEPVARCVLQLGISTAASQPYAGVGVEWNQLRISIYVAYHAPLGLSPGLAFMYTGSKKTR